jgi:hypothetical protein
MILTRITSNANAAGVLTSDSTIRSALIMTVKNDFNEMHGTLTQIGAGRMDYRDLDLNDSDTQLRLSKLSGTAMAMSPPSYSRC